MIVSEGERIHSLKLNILLKTGRGKKKYETIIAFSVKYLLQYN